MIEVKKHCRQITRIPAKAQQKQTDKIDFEPILDTIMMAGRSKPWGIFFPIDDA